MSNYQYSDLNDTIVALSTPPGVGALGVIRLSGKKSVEIADKVFKGCNLNEQASHTVHYGYIYNPTNNAILDEVMLSILRAPRSYTSEDTVEISCHGSPYILQKVLELILNNGARLAQPGEFTMRAFLLGRIDLTQAEAVADLISSESESAHKLALQQMRGGFSNNIADLRQQLIDFASLIELELDFGEEDVEFADRSQLIQLTQNIQSLLRKLIQSFTLGNVLKNGVTTVIAGRPNAGKSTLLNALLNEERALVSDIAGTTRDTIEELISIDGIQFRFIDTAGIREASDAIEAMGVKKTLEKVKQSALVLYVFDVETTTKSKLEEDIQELNLQNLPHLLIGNKIDNKSESTNWQQQYPEVENLIFLSAKEKLALEQLQQALKDKVLNQGIDTSSTVVSNMRHYEALNKSYQALDAVQTGVQSHISGELLALDIRTSLHHLGEITGEVTTDDLLGNIFSNFCIGK